MLKAIILLLLISISFSETPVEESGVFVLTDENFESFIKSHEFVLVKFYAPWCGHCQKLAPEYSQAAIQLKQTDQNIVLAKVDSTKAAQISEKYQIDGYPTLKLFITDLQTQQYQSIDYTGGRDKDGIISWLKKKTGPSSILVTKSEILQKAITDYPVIIVYFGNQQDAEYLEFEKVSKQYDDLVFFHVFNQQIADEYKVKMPTIVLFKAYDEKRNDWNGPFDGTSVINFIETNQYPLIWEFDEKAGQKIFGSQATTLFLVYGQDEASKLALEAFEQIKDEHRGKGQLILCKSKIDSGIGERLGEFLGIGKTTLPQAIIVKFTEKDLFKYKLENKITAEELSKFYKDFQENKLKSFLKSEEIPESNDKPVFKLVGKNFDKEVLQSDKFVLVKFYAPWCQHCQQLAPIYEEIALENKSLYPDLVIAEIDATYNEVPNILIEGFPTIFLYGKNKNAPIKYEGDRTKQSLIDFIQANAIKPKPDL